MVKGCRDQEKLKRVMWEYRVRIGQFYVAVKGFSYEEHFDNLLNLFYFSEEKIIKAINNLNESLLEGGILQIGRTTSEGINNVSFYKKQNGRFILVKRLNSGSEIDYIFERLSSLSSGDRRNVTEEIECVDYEMRMLK